MVRTVSVKSVVMVVKLHTSFHWDPVRVCRNSVPTLHVCVSLPWHQLTHSDEQIGYLRSSCKKGLHSVDILPNIIVLLSTYT